MIGELLQKLLCQSQLGQKRHLEQSLSLGTPLFFQQYTNNPSKVIATMKNGHNSP